MSHARARNEEEIPRFRAHAVLPLGLLELEGESLVEAPHRVEDVAAHGEHRPGEVASRSPPLPQTQRFAGETGEPPIVQGGEATGQKLREVPEEAGRKPGRQPDALAESGV